jgi:hypothetical protein
MLRIDAAALLRQFLAHWRPFLAVHLAVTLLSATVLLPAAAALLRLAVFTTCSSITESRS